MSVTSLPTVVLLRHQLFLPSEVFITEQARAMRQFRPLLLGRSVEGAPRSGIEYFSADGRNKYDLARYMTLRDPNIFESAWRDCQPAVVHAHFGVEGVYGLALAERLGVPLVTTFHGFDATLRTSQLLSAKKISWAIYALNRSRLAHQGSLFLCVSRFIHERVIDMGFPPERTRVHYIGVDPDAFPESSEDPERPILLHIARLVEKKGTRHLVRAFASISDRFPQARLVVIGDGPLRSSLQELAAALKVADRIDWLGARPHTEVKHWLSRASVFCLPSCTAGSGDAEGLGIVLLEAAASGVPVVGTRHGGIPEAVIDGTSGILVGEGDPESLAEALDALLSSHTLRRQFGQQGRAFVRSRFNIAYQTGLLESDYLNLL
jgi:colanic acid/amylovoran biosynthesis glycosyltransferase